MARSVFPDEGSRLVFRLSGSNKPLLSAAGGVATVYVDDSGVSPADIRTLDGLSVPGSQLTIDAQSRLPMFLGPDDVDVVYVSVDGGVFAPVYARADDRLDSVEELGATVVRSVNGFTPDPLGAVTIAPGGVAEATATVKGVIQLAGDLGGTAAAPTVPGIVKTSGAQVIAGVKTLTDPPTVPDGSFTIAKTTGLQAALDAKSSPTVPLNTQSGAYTLSLADAGKIVQINTSSANILTIPADTSVDHPVGTVIGVAQIGVGLTTITPASGVALTWNNGTAGTGAKALAGQYSDVTLLKTAANAWRVAGALAA